MKLQELYQRTKGSIEVNKSMVFVEDESGAREVYQVDGEGNLVPMFWDKPTREALARIEARLADR